MSKNTGIRSIGFFILSASIIFVTGCTSVSDKIAMRQQLDTEYQTDVMYRQQLVAMLSALERDDVYISCPADGCQFKELKININKQDLKELLVMPNRPEYRTVGVALADAFKDFGISLIEKGPNLVLAATGIYGMHEMGNMAGEITRMLGNPNVTTTTLTNSGNSGTNFGDGINGSGRQGDNTGNLSGSGQIGDNSGNLLGSGQQGDTTGNNYSNGLLGDGVNGYQDNGDSSRRYIPTSTEPTVTTPAPGIATN